MALTVSTSSTAFCTAARLLDYFDARAVADLVRDDNGGSPTRMALLDSTDTAGGRVAQALLAASGLVESAATKGKKYAVTDLAALTGTSRAHLERLVAGLAFGSLMARRQPVAAARDRVPAVKDAEDLLERLRLGEHVFGFAESQAAAESMDGLRVSDNSATAYAERTNSVVTRASRYFGNRQPQGAY